MPGGEGHVLGPGPGRVGGLAALVAPPMGYVLIENLPCTKGGGVSPRPQCRLPAADRASDREITGDGEGGM